MWCLVIWFMVLGLWLLVLGVGSENSEFSEFSESSEASELSEGSEFLAGTYEALLAELVLAGLYGGVALLAEHRHHVFGVCRVALEV